LYVYYAGHGATKDSMTQIHFNNEDEGYNLELILTNLACKNTYTIAVFDCCRTSNNAPPLSNTIETKT
jgi:hypothetical protein